MNATLTPRLNRSAVAAIALSPLGGVLGLVFGIVALRQIRRTGERGRSLATDGIAISIVVMLVLGGFAGYRAFAGPHRTDLLYVETGECLDDIRNLSTLDALPRVPCDGPHDGEVFATFEIHADGDIEGEATTGCAERLAGYAPAATGTSALVIRHRAVNFKELYGRGWRVLCVVVDARGVPRTTPVRA
jgi:Domain of unknown function (DUF4190)